MKTTTIIIPKLLVRLTVLSLPVSLVWLFYLSTGRVFAPEDVFFSMPWNIASVIFWITALTVYACSDADAREKAAKAADRTAAGLK